MTTVTTAVPLTILRQGSAHVAAYLFKNGVDITDAPDLFHTFGGKKGAWGYAAVSRTVKTLQATGADRATIIQAADREARAQSASFAAYRQAMDNGMGKDAAKAIAEATAEAIRQGKESGITPAESVLESVQADESKPEKVKGKIDTGFSFEPTPDNPMTPARTDEGYAIRFTDFIMSKAEYRANTQPGVDRDSSFPVGKEFSINGNRYQVTSHQKNSAIKFNVKRLAGKVPATPLGKPADARPGQTAKVPNPLKGKTPPAAPAPEIDADTLKLAAAIAALKAQGLL